MEDVISYINEHKETYIEELKNFLRIPSISTLPESKGDIRKAAEFVANKLNTAGIAE